MTTAESSSLPAQTIELQPSYTIPVVLVILAIPLLLVKAWLSLVISLLGFFLLFQTSTIRLKLTETALELYRYETLIRCFPYQEWQSWQIFWPTVPILFYFREVKSIHFLPILFDPKMLQNCLEQRCPKKES